MSRIWRSASVEETLVIFDIHVNGEEVVRWQPVTWWRGTNDTGHECAAVTTRQQDQLNSGHGCGMIQPQAPMTSATYFRRRRRRRRWYEGDSTMK